MPDPPSHVLADQTRALLREGYRFLSNRRERYGSDVFEIRVLGRRAICLVGAEGARLLYDETRFQRAGVLPWPVRATLVGNGGVQGLDGAAHLGRKAMFMNLMTRERVGELGELASRHWREAIAGWPGRGSVVLFDEAARVLVRAACDWLGVPLPEAQASARARDMVAMVDGFGSAGRRHWRGQLARRRSEAWIARVGPPEPFHTLQRRVAAVEVLNVIRPIVAIAWFVAFGAHALHYQPQWRAKLRYGDDALLTQFVHEVRRFYPFAPAVGAQVRADFSWRGHRFPRGRLVLLDVFGTDRDPRRWADPDDFIPERFADRDIDPYELIPQGGGDPDTGHRCAGEQITVELTKVALSELVRVAYELPPQDLAIPLDQIPTRARSGIIMNRVVTGNALHETRSHPHRLRR